MTEPKTGSPAAGPPTHSTYTGAPYADNPTPLPTPAEPTEPETPETEPVEPPAELPAEPGAEPAN